MFLKIGSVEDLGLEPNPLPTLYSKDGKIALASESKIDKDAVIENGSDIFNTLTMESDYQSLLSKFIELRSNIHDQDPNAKISICEQNVIVRSDGKMSIYHIHKNDFVKLKINTISQVNIPSVERQTETALTVAPKENFFSKFITRIKRSLFAGRGDSIIYKDENLYNNVANSSYTFNSLEKSTFDEQLKVSDFHQRLDESSNKQSEIGKQYNLNQDDRGEEK